MRAGLSDTALFLGIATRALIDRDPVRRQAFLKRFTDMPLLIRLDTLQRLRADEVFAGYSRALATDGPEFRHPRR